MLSTLLPVLFLSAAFAGAAPAETGEDLQAWIDTEEGGGMIALKSMARADAAMTVRYSLTLERVSGSGRSQSSQSGQVSLQGSEPVTLSRSSVNAVEDGYLEATLTVSGPSGEEVTDIIRVGREDR